MFKTYQFQTHCKADNHSFKTANVILSGLLIKHRCTPLQAKSCSYSSALMLVETTHVTEFVYHVPLIQVRAVDYLFTFYGICCLNRQVD